MSLYFANYKANKFVPLNRLQEPIKVNILRDENNMYSIFLSLQDNIIYAMINNTHKVVPLQKQNIKEKDVIRLSVYKHKIKIEESKEKNINKVANGMTLVLSKEYIVRLNSYCSYIKVDPYAICVKDDNINKKPTVDKMDIQTLRNCLMLQKKKFSLSDSREKLCCWLKVNL